MTKERREEVILVALVASVAVHVGLMLLAKPQVMTRIAPRAERAVRRPAAQVTKAVPRPEPVKLEVVPDEAARKDAPAIAAAASAPQAPAPDVESAAAKVPLAAPSDPTLSVEEPKTVFEAVPVGREPAVPSFAPLVRIETPTPAAAAAKPDFTVAVPVTVRPRLAPAPAQGTGPSSAFLPTRLVRERAAKPTYTPAEEIYAKVDEKIVTEEKKAVRELVEADEAADLVKFANVTMTSASAGGWRYFKVRVSPRSSLKVVPKDVVMVIDGSGSIGNDRLANCRKAARRILRTATNTGDRFNLVVFRNAFSYAFRTWRDCDAASFAAGDKWLANQTAHGRTDVFSTISSVLTLPRDPRRPLIALVVTDGDANAGVSDTAEILAKFTALNDGLVSVYMYGVKSSANRELIDVLTHGNRGESFVFEGWRWSSGEGMEALSERFRDPVLSDLRVVFSSDTRAEAYPRLLRNLHKGDTLSFVGRVPADAKDVAFSLKGLNGDAAYEGFFRLPFAAAPDEPALVSEWTSEQAIDRKLGGAR